MTATYEILVAGNDVSWRGGLGFANLTLVEGPAGLLLFDTGHFTNRSDLLGALSRRGLVPGDIERVFLSHIHFDHVENVDLFPAATLFLGRPDWAYAESPAAGDFYVPWLIRDQLGLHHLELLDGDTDLGGGITALALPGHTPGSMGIMFDSEQGRVVIAGDAVRTLAEAAHEPPPGPEHQFPVSDTRAHALASLARVKGLADRVVPGHLCELQRVDGQRLVPVGPRRACLS